MKVLKTFALLTCLTVCGVSAFADDKPAQEIANIKTTENQQEAGPYVTDPTKAPKVVKGESAAEVDFNKLKNVDLKKEPWLVESVGLTPGHPAFQRPRMIWADSWMYAEAPEIEIEKWVTEPPKDLAGKFVLIEVWATWCPPCRRSLPYLNFLHEKYGDNLVVIAICETDEESIKTMKGPLKPDEIKFHLAVDTGRRFANKLSVYGIPHTVILEPQFGAVIWEGMPTQPGHELSDEKVTKILSIGKKLKESGEVPKTSPLKITVSKPEKTVQPPKGEGNSVQW
ncbi:MAG: TlpA family protein disulfide reductase [Planctomycetaceae bacterium]|jgi:thiol-disulfide isomerase/thioredoxin|nr:TlpA family protein disulfide reductase [Planctomycetaceae bacterium]